LAGRQLPSPYHDATDPPHLAYRHWRRDHQSGGSVVM